MSNNDIGNGFINTFLVQFQKCFLYPFVKVKANVLPYPYLSYIFEPLGIANKIKVMKNKIYLFIQKYKPFVFYVCMPQPQCELKLSNGG